MKKLTFVIAALFAGVASMPVYAISAKYRAQLERSGCTQVTDGNGCDIHKTKAQNADSDLSGLNDLIQNRVLWKSSDDAHKALEGNGFQNNEPYKWVKGNKTITLTVNPHDIIESAIIK